MINIIHGDSAEVLDSLKKDHFHSLVTSPPYYKKRRYRSDPDVQVDDGGDLEIGWEPYVRCGRVRKRAYADGAPFRRNCCYMCSLLHIFRKAQHVLRDDATLWINIADTYDNGRLMGIPEKFIETMTIHGFEFISRIIWHIPNKMPEPGRKRPARSYEFILVFRNSKKSIITPNHYYDWYAGLTEGKLGQQVIGRDLWSISVHATEKTGHFATYPVEVPERCIKIGTPERVCSLCGTPYERQVESFVVEDPRNPNKVIPYTESGDSNGSGATTLHQVRKYATAGWNQQCVCGTPAYLPGRVLDPFAGEGTTGVAATKLLRDAVMIEIEKKYVTASSNRLDFPVQPNLI